MKEATGELSGTVITVVAIAAVAAIFTVIVLPIVRNSIRTRTMCAQASCPAGCVDRTCNCTYIDENGDAQDVTCVNPNSQDNN